MQLLGIAFALASIVAGEELLQEMGGNSDSFFVVPAVGCGHARDACARNGGRLADITIENVLKASRVAISRNGPYTSSWVASWNGDKYGDACLALSVDASGVGALNVLPGCRSHKMALCERVSDCNCKDPLHHKQCHKCRKTKTITRTTTKTNTRTPTVFVTVTTVELSVDTSTTQETSSASTTETLTSTATTIETDSTSQTVTLTETTISTDPPTITSTFFTTTTSSEIDTTTSLTTISTTLTDPTTSTLTLTDTTSETITITSVSISTSVTISAAG